MRTLTSGLLVGVLAGTPLLAQGVNVSGKWSVERVAPNGNVQRLPIELNQIGARVYGTVGGGGGGGGSAAPINNEIHEGKVDGSTVTFYVWRGADRPFKVQYAGVLSARGDELAFTVTGGPVFPGGGGGGPTPAQAAATPAAQATVAVQPPPAAATPTQIVAGRAGAIVTALRSPSLARAGVLLALSLAALSARVPPGAAQQITTGTVTGLALDSQGLVLPGVNVELVNEQTADVRQTSSNREGLFTFSAVPQAAYTLKLSLDGFKTAERRGIQLRAGEVYNGRVVLEVGALTEVTTVAADLAVVQSGTASRSAVIESRQMDSLLSRGRDPMSLLNTLPGVTPVTDVTSLGGQIGPVTPAIAGQRGAAAGLSLDGMAASDGDTGRNTSPISVDAIDQINVSLNTYQAEQGRNSGAQVNIVSKSGTREFHGTLATYVRNEALNRNNYFNTLNSLPKPLYRYNTLTGTLGGPVLLPGGIGKGRDRIFFFYVREMWWAQEPRNPRFITTPTELERAGDFSQSFDQNGRLITITDPQTGRAFPGNRIPGDRINANGQAILNLLPLPNFTDRSVSNGAYNYRDQDIADVRKTLDQFKVDANLSDRDRLSVRWRRWRPVTEAYSGTFAVSSNWNQFRHGYAQREDSVQVSHTRTLGASIVNEATSSFRYLKEVGPTIETLDGVTRSQRGLGGLPSLFGANAANITPAATFGGVPGTAPTLAFDGRFPIDGEDHRWVVADNLSWAKGRHLFKTGVYYELNRNSEGPGPFANCFSGCYNFAADVNNPGNSGYAFANAVLGAFVSYQEATSRPIAAGTAQFVEWFAQDSWKPSNTLTLELGVRFSYGQPWHLLKGATGGSFVSDRWRATATPRLFTPATVDGRRVGIDRPSGQIVAPALIGAIVPNSGDPYNGIVTQDDALAQAGWRDTPSIQVQPRVGFAWDPKGDGRTAVRGGFGISTQVLQDSGDFSNRHPAAPPARTQPQIFYGGIATLNASQGYLFPDTVPAYSLDYTPARTYNFSIEIQRNIGFDTIVSAAYVGNRQRNLIQSRNLNLLPYGARFDPANADPTNPTRPLPDAFLTPIRGYNAINVIENTGYGDYDSLQMTANRRYKNGLQLGLAYTLARSRNLTDGDGGALPVYTDVRAYTYDDAGFDRRHVLTFNYVWAIPHGSRLWDTAVSRALLDNWQIAGVTLFSTGAPSGVTFTTTDGADLLGGGDPGRINVTGNPILSNPTFERWFDPTVFARPARGDRGNAGRQVVRLPGVRNWDVTLSKILLGHTTRGLQFRAEFYNLFNTNNWTAVDTVARFDAQGNQVNTRLGQVTAAADPRIIQLSLRLMF